MTHHKHSFCRASRFRLRKFRLRKLSKNRRGVELSINFVVLLIMAIAMFIGGLVFAAKFFRQAETLRGTLSSQTERQLEKLLDSGSPVVIPINSKEIFRNKYDSFALGILAQDSGSFFVDIKVTSAFKKDKSSIFNKAQAVEWLSYAGKDGKVAMTLQKNEKGKMVILVDVPSNAERGTYIFKVEVRFVHASDVTKNRDPYDAPLQMIVNVP